MSIIYPAIDVDVYFIAEEVILNEERTTDEDKLKIMEGIVWGNESLNYCYNPSSVIKHFKCDCLVALLWCNKLL